jgi:hypothetical protein
MPDSARGGIDDILDRYMANDRSNRIKDVRNHYKHQWFPREGEDLSHGDVLYFDQAEHDLKRLPQGLTGERLTLSPVATIEGGGFESGSGWTKSLGFGSGSFDADTSDFIEGSQSATFTGTDVQIERTFSPSLDLSAATRLLVYRYEKSSPFAGERPRASFTDKNLRGVANKEFTLVAGQVDADGVWALYEFLMSRFEDLDPLFDISAIDLIAIGPSTNFIDSGSGDKFLLDALGIDRINTPVEWDTVAASGGGSGDSFLEWGGF